jgi:hypothetical protein
MDEAADQRPRKLLISVVARACTVVQCEHVVEKMRAWLAGRNSRQQQWLWFFVLWLVGLLAVSLLAWPLRWLVRAMSGY